MQDVNAVGGNPIPLTQPNDYFEGIMNVRFRVGSQVRMAGDQPSVRADYYALYSTGKRIESPVTYPDEVMEGDRKTVTVNAYERDPRASLACLKRWGYKCYVCKMKFVETYGPIGEEFIHVHHLNPLSEVGKRHRVDGARDLRPVCPNCHAMLHRGSPPPTIKELQEYLRTAAEIREIKRGRTGTTR